MRSLEEERLMRRVLKTDECWIFTGSLASTGYGQLTIRGKVRSAHRIAYEVFKGPILNGEICHTCDNRACVNPDHLIDADRTWNMRDCSRKGRLKIPHFSGERSSRAILSQADVDNIRRMISEGHQQKIIATKYGVCKSTIGKIATGKNWKQLVAA